MKREIFVFALKTVFVERDLCVDPEIHLLILPCAFIHFEAVLMPYIITHLTNTLLQKYQY